jgi:cystathionine beta-lyase
MQKYDFDQYINRRNTHSIKWDRYPGQILPLWVADLDFLSPPAVIEALLQRVEHGVFGYSYPDPELKEVIVDRLAARYEWKVDPEWLVFMPGIVSGLNLFCHTFSNFSKDVVVQTPVYPPILHAPDISHLQRHEIPLVQSESGRYEIDFDHFNNVVSRQASQFILCNPHNPTGRVFTYEEMQKFAEICIHNKVLVCSDEIHSDMLYSGFKHIPLASISPEIAKLTITFIAPSKTFNIAGLDCSVAIISDPDLREQFSVEKDAYAGHVNALGLTAALTAYKAGDEWLEPLMVYLEENRNAVNKFVNERLDGVNSYSPEGTYLSWLDCRSLDLQPNPSQFFIDNASVGLNNGSDFGEPGNGFVRLNFGCSRKVLWKALEQMESAINGISVSGVK